jgi:transcriptional regulator with XRE-family HTH domain
MNGNSRWELRRRRLAAGVSLAAVAARFGCGVSRERIRQIEAASRVRLETRAEYERALAAAIKQRAAIAQLLRALSE